MDMQVLVLGEGDIFDQAVVIAEATHAPGAVQSMEISAPDGFNFELPDLSAYPPDQWALFLAIDDRGLNMSRHQLVAQAKARGYKLAKLIAPDAQVSASATVGENALIAKGAIIQRNCKLGLNIFVLPWARIGEDCKIRNGAYLDVGCSVGRASELGDYVTVGAGAVVAAGAKIGRYCELRLAQTYKGEIPDKTFYFDPLRKSCIDHRPALGSRPGARRQEAKCPVPNCMSGGRIFMARKSLFVTRERSSNRAG